MIRINLLPEKETKKRRRVVERPTPQRKVSPLTVLVALLIVAAIAGYYYYGIRRPLAAKHKRKTELELKIKNLDKQIAKIRDSVAGLKAAESITKDMLNIVYALDPPDRILWSEKLNQISDLVPDNVYITRITVTETIKKKETLESQKRRREWAAAHKKRKGRRKSATTEKAPAPVYYPEITQTLTIRAIAYSENESDRIRLINEFYDNLMSGTNPQAKISEDFMKGFKGTIEYGDIAPKVVGGRQVAEFSFKLRTKPTAPKSGS